MWAVLDLEADPVLRASRRPALYLLNKPTGYASTMCISEATSLIHLAWSH